MSAMTMEVAWAAVAAGMAGIGCLILVVDAKARTERENAMLKRKLEELWEERRKGLFVSRGEVRREYAAQAAKMQKRGADGRFEKGGA